MEISVKTIGVISSPFSDEKNTPIQPDKTTVARGIIKIFPEFVSGLEDIDGFERIWLIYYFHKACQSKLKVIPYLDHNEKGVFATRAPCRPSRVGLSCVRLIKIISDEIHVAEIDLLDGTPIIDVKPYVPQFDRFEVTKTGWLENSTPTGVKADGRFSRSQ